MSRRAWFWFLVLVGLLAFPAAHFITASDGSRTPPAWFAVGRSRPEYALTAAFRTDLAPRLNAMGEVSSSVRTVIRCELERIPMSGSGGADSAQMAGGASSLLSIVPDGSQVRKGDVLAVLDASTYEEMLRQQQIVVEQARSTFRQAELDVEIARLAVREYKEGQLQEMLQGMDGEIALAKSDVERATDRLAWSRRMKDKDYASASQVITDQNTLAQMRFKLEQLQSERDLFVRYTSPKDLVVLEGDVKAAEATLKYEQQRLDRSLSRLALLERQVARCTIRAPHDGIVVYANNPRRDIVIEEGMAVRQNQELMYLPDLSRLEVVAYVHETIVDQIEPGFPATVVVEAMPGGRMEGRVSAINPVSMFNRRTPDLRYFPCTITLDKVAPGVKPGMTAQIEVRPPARANALVVPQQAVHREDGREVCYVPRGDRIEPRPLVVGETTPDLVEVLDGLNEGDQVVLDPEPGPTATQ